MSSPALAENTNAAPAAAEPVVAAKKAKTSVEGKASPTKVVEAPAEEPKRKESGEGAVAEKPAEPAAEPAKEVPVPRRQRLLHAIELCAVAAVDRFTHRPPPRSPPSPRRPSPPSPPPSRPRRFRSRVVNVSLRWRGGFRCRSGRPVHTQASAEPVKEAVVEAPKEAAAPAEEPNAVEPAAEPAKPAEEAKPVEEPKA